MVGRPLPICICGVCHPITCLIPHPISQIAKPRGRTTALPTSNPLYTYTWLLVFLPELYLFFMRMFSPFYFQLWCCVPDDINVTQCIHIVACIWVLGPFLSNEVGISLNDKNPDRRNHFNRKFNHSKQSTQPPLDSCHCTSIGFFTYKQPNQTQRRISWI